VVALVSALPAFILSAQASIASHVTLPRASGNLWHARPIAIRLL